MSVMFVGLFASSNADLSGKKANIAKKEKKLYDNSQGCRVIM